MTVANGGELQRFSRTIVNESIGGRGGGIEITALWETKEFFGVPWSSN